MIKRNASMSDSLKFLKSRDLPVSYIIDIGILHCTEALVNVFPNLKHYLVEPVRSYHKQIEDFYVNQGIDYTLIGVAAAGSNKHVRLIEYAADGGSTLTHSRITDLDDIVEDQRAISQVVIEAMTIQRILDTNCYTSFTSQHPFLLKIDIDGLEDEILEVSSDALKSCNCIILEIPIIKFLKRINLLGRLGFSLVDIVDHAYYKSGLSQVDGIFIRNEYIDALKINTWHNESVVDFSQWQQN